jgi:antitoxin component of RelBE/YafQ-DinJ toxin-antitoxin module
MAKVTIFDTVERVKIKGKRKALLHFLSGLTHTLAQVVKMPEQEIVLTVDLPVELSAVNEDNHTVAMLTFSNSDLRGLDEDFASVKQARHKLANKGRKA